jgi:hypothetical protein
VVAATSLGPVDDEACGSCVTDCCDSCELHGKVGSVNAQDASSVGDAEGGEWSIRARGGLFGGAIFGHSLAMVERWLVQDGDKL